MPNKVEIKSIVLTVDDKDVAMTVEQARMLKIQLEGLFGKEEPVAKINWRREGDVTLWEERYGCWWGDTSAAPKPLSLLVQRLNVNDTHL